MDGNKKIIHFVYSLLLVAVLTACSVQNTSYTGLYVDNYETEEFPDEIGVAETIEESLELNESLDSNLTYETEKTSIFFSSDSLVSKKLVYENKSSLTNKSSKADKESLKEKQKDSVNHTNLEAQNKNLENLEKQLQKNQKSMLGRDSTYVLTTSEKLQILSRKNEFEKDSMEKKNVESSSNQTLTRTPDAQVQKKDTVFVIKEIYKDRENKPDNSKKENETATENKRLQERIERLESQQDSKNREPIYIEREAPRENERSDERTRYDTNQTQYIPIPVPNLQQNQDTVYVEKEAPARDTVLIENKRDRSLYATLNSQNDTINQLKNQLRQKQLQQQKTDTIYKTNEVAVYKTQEVDTLRLTAFYEMGKTKPSSNVLEELKEKTEGKSVIKVMLSGHTDASGNQNINKALTDKRLNYIKEFISTFIPIDKIYVQNFGNRFASEEVIATERRVEITLYTKLENELKDIEK